HHWIQDQVVRIVWLFGLNLWIIAVMLTLLVVLVFSSFVPEVNSLKCMHNATVSDIFYEDHGFSTGSADFLIPIGILNCNPGLDRCVVFHQMLVTDYMNLDVATKDPDYTNHIKNHNYKVSGRACMSESDCNKIKAQKADICIRSVGGQSCYCTTGACNGIDKLSLLIPLISILVYFLSN
ncbi:hypothetical protein PFISCL1PPCAC_28703, partial [Pristionchus fissidentatus]